MLGGGGFGIVTFDEFLEGFVEWRVCANGLHVIVTGVTRGDLDLDDAVGEDVGVGMYDMEARDEGPGDGASEDGEAHWEDSQHLA